MGREVGGGDLGPGMWLKEGNEYNENMLYKKLNKKYRKRTNSTKSVNFPHGYCGISHPSHRMHMYNSIVKHK